MATHIPVLLKETIAGLNLNDGDTALDATLGGGGHSEALCARIGGTGTFIGMDADEDAVLRAKEKLASCKARIILETANFRTLSAVLDKHRIKAINAALFDLGMSSFQLEESNRGFSFQRNEPLMMTFEKKASADATTAYDIINRWEEDSIEAVLSGYGEERFARKIAWAVILARKEKPIRTTDELVAVIKGAVPEWYCHKRLHCATKTFQALRIAVNDEFGALKEALAECFARLAPLGRMAVISFHSAEDRIVKLFFREQKLSGQAVLISKKPIQPSRIEQKENPRARSAQLRILEKTEQ
ncbi:MAG: 16S rRNA (cytosine(1402)-N(4))-methyltransferase RsmH [Candidatus Lloydbacteria bacterium]|nr:16S rRNA (cytosine(1402)-N(4))-methyltransferase RsmH [Candidatus Lloydbacteria bacterium]